MRRFRQGPRRVPPPESLKMPPRATSPHRAPAPRCRWHPRCSRRVDPARCFFVRRSEVYGKQHIMRTKRLWHLATALMLTVTGLAQAQTQYTDTTTANPNMNQTTDPTTTPPNTTPMDQSTTTTDDTSLP